MTRSLSTLLITFLAFATLLASGCSSPPSPRECSEMAMAVSDPKASVEARAAAAVEYLTLCLPKSVSLGEALKTRSLGRIIGNTQDISLPNEIAGGAYFVHTQFILDRLEADHKDDLLNAYRHLLMLFVRGPGTSDDNYGNAVSITFALDQPVPQEARADIKTALLNGSLSHLRIIGWSTGNGLHPDKPTAMYKDKFYSTNDLIKEHEALMAPPSSSIFSKPSSK